MNPYQHKVHCSVCGGEGVGTGSTLTAEWTGIPVVHDNPNICIRNLEKKRVAREQAAEDKAAQERAVFDADDEYMFEQFEESQK